VSAYVVPLDAPGVTRRATPGNGAGFRSVLSHFDFSRAALGLLCLGVCLGAAQASLDEALAYSTQREAFGQYVMAYLIADGTAEIQKKVIAREAYRRGRVSW
jgi:cyclohexanecarboxyl-CoA dehydrogenase